MSISFSAAASVYRATNKDRMEAKKIGFRSEGKEEFASAIDFSDAANPPNLPMSVVSPHIRTIRFLTITCTGGGTCVIRLISGNTVGKYIDIPFTNGSMIISGVELTGVIVISVDGLGYAEIAGCGD